MNLSCWKQYSLSGSSQVLFMHLSSSRICMSGIRGQANDWPFLHFFVWMRALSDYMCLPFKRLAVAMMRRADG